jgi:hypothetical protein
MRILSSPLFPAEIKQRRSSIIRVMEDDQHRKHDTTKEAAHVVRDQIKPSLRFMVSPLGCTCIYTYYLSIDGD